MSLDKEGARNNTPKHWLWWLLVFVCVFLFYWNIIDFTMLCQFLLYNIMNQPLLLFSSPVVSNSLQPHRVQHARPSCPSPSPRVCPVSCPLHHWYHPFISSSDAFPASGTFPMSHLFALDDQNTGASASASVLPVNIQGWSPLRLTGLISLLSKWLSGVFSSTTVQRHQFYGILPSL